MTLLVVGLGFWNVSNLAQNSEKEKPSVTTTEFKMVCLAKIPNYIMNWSESREPIVIGLLGADPFQGMLHKLTEKATSRGRRMEVRVVPSVGELTNCNIVFITAALALEWDRAVRTNGFKGVLTVGESTNFVERMNTVFNLSAENQKLEVSLPNAKQAGIQINSKLLKMATVHR